MKKKKVEFSFGKHSIEYSSKNGEIIVCSSTFPTHIKMRLQDIDEEDIFALRDFFKDIASKLER